MSFPGFGTGDLWPRAFISSIPGPVSFGVAVITPRWLYVLAAATGTEWGDPRLVDETLEQIDYSTLTAGDVVGIGIHTGNARRGYEIGREARARGAWVVYGGIHATLFPDEAYEHGGAHAVVRGDGDIGGVGGADCLAGQPLALYKGGQIGGDRFLSARWDLLPAGRYMWASVQTGRGCPKHCSFCSGVAHRWSGATAAQRRSRRAGDRRAAAARIPVHRTGGRQLLSGDARRSGVGPPPRWIRHAFTSSKRCARNASR